MHLSITDNVTQQDKDELFTGLRAYNESDAQWNENSR